MTDKEVGQVWEKWQNVEGETADTIRSLIARLVGERLKYYNFMDIAFGKKRNPLIPALKDFSVPKAAMDRWAKQKPKKRR